MKKSLFVKTGLLAALCATALVGQSKAGDLADAAWVMSKIETLSINAKAKLAAAAVDEGANAVLEAKKRSDDIDAAVDAARAAYSKMEQAVNSGDTDGAAAAEKELAAKLVLVKNALTGNPSGESVAASSNKKSGHKTGRPDNPPNIYEVPFASGGIKAYYEELFGEFWNASAFGHGQGFGDRDATPE